MKTHFQSFFKMFCKLITVFGFPKNSKTNFKRDFVFKWKLFQVVSLSCKKEFCFGKKTTSPFVPKIFFKEKVLSQMAFEIALQNFGAWKCFQLVFKLASQKPWITKTKWFQNEFWTWFAWVSKTLLRYGRLQKIKTNLIKENCLPPFYKNNLLGSKDFMQTAFKKSPSFKIFLPKASLQNLMH